MSLFGGGGFGSTSTTTTTTQPSSGLFSTTQNKPFAGFGTSTTQPQQQQQQQRQQHQQQTTSLFGQPQQQQHSTGLFGQSQQQQGSSLFGQSQQAQPAGTTSLFGRPARPNNPFDQSQQQAQRPLDQTLRFGFGESQQSVAQAQNAKEPWWQEGRGMGVYRSIPDQMQLIKDKWDPASVNSPLRTYLYQHVQSETEALKYSPGPSDDGSKWEEAVEKRPGPEWVPVIARGFGELGRRAQMQMEAIARCNMMLNEINTSLDIQLDVHRQKVASRLEECRRRHKAISQRTLSLAVKVQVLKNRGYVMDNAEEELKTKLSKLESEVLDPSINAREQEIWARMLGIRERAKRLQDEMKKLQPATQEDESLLDEDTIKAARKTLDAYDTQLQHLQKELRLVQDEYADWERSASGSAPDRSRAR